MRVKVGNDEIELDFKLLDVNEANLNDFLKTFAGTYAYYNSCLAKAQFIQYLSEDKHDQVSSEKFQNYKENEGGSDKLVDAKVTISESVIKACRAAREAKYMAQLLSGFLKSMERAHENALNLGYNIRKEIDKLYPQHIQGASSVDADGLPKDVDKAVEKLMAESM